MLFIAPLRQRQTCLGFVIDGLMMVLLTFSLFSATVLAEPAVAQVEEVCGLMHNLATELCTSSYDRLLAYGWVHHCAWTHK
ncbi:MAG TPA: hypothetical protein VGP85_09385 [Pyrinomonadaceae bacterium]|nr:hypothetical protein [Pyrinomonadaceae bacterium]